MKKKQKIMLIRILAAAALLIAWNIIPLTGLLRLLCFAAVYLIIGYDILYKAGRVF